MKPFITLLISLVLMTTTSFSQATLPNTIPTEKDTAFSVLNDDLASVNHMMVDLDACNELADSLNSEIKNYQELKKKDDVLIKKQGDDNKVLEGSVKALTDLKESYKAGETTQKRRNKWIKGFATGFGIVAALEAGYIAIQTAFRP